MWQFASYGWSFIAPILLIIFGEQLQGFRMQGFSLEERNRKGDSIAEHSLQTCIEESTFRQNSHPQRAAPQQAKNRELHPFPIRMLISQN